MLSFNGGSYRATDHSKPFFLFVPVDGKGLAVERWLADYPELSENWRSTDPLLENPSRVGEEWDEEQRGRRSPSAYLVNEDYPPTSDGLVIATDSLKLHFIGSKPSSGYGIGDPDWLARLIAKTGPGRKIGNWAVDFGPGVRVAGALVRHHAETGRPMSPIVNAALTEHSSIKHAVQSVSVRPLDSDVRLEQSNRGWTAHYYDETFRIGEGIFRADSDPQPGPAAPSQMAAILEALSVAGVAEPEVRDLATQYRQFVADEQVPRIQMAEPGRFRLRPNGPPKIAAVTARHGFGSNVTETTVTPRGATSVMPLAKYFQEPKPAHKDTASRILDHTAALVAGTSNSPATSDSVAELRKSAMQKIK